MGETSDPSTLFECFNDAGADFVYPTSRITTDTGAERCEVVDAGNIGRVDDEGFDLDHHVIVRNIFGMDASTSCTSPGDWMAMAG